MSNRTDIAVVGVSAIFPGSVDKTGFWNDILAGRDLITDVPDTHWLIEDYFDEDPSARDKTYGKRGAFLGDIDFDPMAFGVPPSIVPATDTNQLLALIVAKRVLEDACQGDWLACQARQGSWGAWAAWLPADIPGCQGASAAQALGVRARGPGV